MSKSLCVAVLLCVGVFAAVHGQNMSADSEVLDNEKVLALIKAGLPNEIIVTKIRTSKSDFNTNSDELIRLQQSQVPSEIISAMIEASSQVKLVSRGRTVSESTDLARSPANYPVEIGVYLKQEDRWNEVWPEVVNWKTGGVVKSLVTAGIVKTDINGHLEGNQSRTRIGAHAQFTIVVPEGVSITEYQLLRLNKHKDNREFRAMTGGVFHAKGGATPDLETFEWQKIGSRIFLVNTKTLKSGEYGFLPPGAFASASGALTLGKIYTFSVVQQ